jgi:regulator of protease activity HflC (stomatin/prohibitin superfamily)
MDEQNILGHLLKIEAEASALVDDAQAEADRRVSEGEKQNRILYDERYAASSAEAEVSYTEAIERVREDYRSRLEDYRKSLEAMPLDETNFSNLMEKYIAGGI